MIWPDLQYFIVYVAGDMILTLGAFMLAGSILYALTLATVWAVRDMRTS